MTVAELINFLSTLHPGLPVKVSWEGSWQDVVEKPAESVWHGGDARIEVRDEAVVIVAEE